jgi:copper chaperone
MLTNLEDRTMERLRIEIEGMSCGHCVKSVRGTLEKVPGVQVEQVEIGRATLDFDPDVTTPHKIVQAVEGSGYATRVA